VKREVSSKATAVALDAKQINRHPDKQKSEMGYNVRDINCVRIQNNTDKVKMEKVRKQSQNMEYSHYNGLNGEE
jgi:hypothetical protein